MAQAGADHAVVLFLRQFRKADFQIDVGGFAGLGFEQPADHAQEAANKLGATQG